MKITVHYCDFSTQVQQHLAHFTISARGKEAEKDDPPLDACVDHLCQMVDALVLAPDLPATEVVVRRLSGVKELPAKKKSVTPGKHSCPVCGAEVRNLYSHAKVHGLKNTAELREAAELGLT